MERSIESFIAEHFAEDALRAIAQCRDTIEKYNNGPISEIHLARQAFTTAYNTGAIGVHEKVADELDEQLWSMVNRNSSSSGDTGFSETATIALETAMTIAGEYDQTKANSVHLLLASLRTNGATQELFSAFRLGYDEIVTRYRNAAMNRDMMGSIGANLHLLVWDELKNSVLSKIVNAEEFALINEMAPLSYMNKKLVLGLSEELYSKAAYMTELIIHKGREYLGEGSDITFTIGIDIEETIGITDKEDAPVTPKQEEKKARERIIIRQMSRFNIAQKFDGVLNVAEQAKEFTDLLSSLNFDQGMMVGLFGRWGRGKTFFWNTVKQNLESLGASNPFKNVEFHAWKYQDTPASWAYLYEVLAKEFYKKPGKILSKGWLGYYKRLITLNLERKGWMPVLKFLMIITSGVLAVNIIGETSTNFLSDIGPALRWIGIPLTAAATIYTSFQYIKKTYSSEAKDLFLMYSQQHSFKNHLGLQAEIQKEIATLLEVWIQKEKERILIFVDDIDRCKEDRIIEIIDALRIMLDDLKISNKVVVLAAVDERVLKRAIANKYQDLIDKEFCIEDKDKKYKLEQLVKEYMDKLFVAGIKLNNLSAGERKEILKTITNGRINIEVHEEYAPESVEQASSGQRQQPLEPEEVASREYTEQELKMIQATIPPQTLTPPVQEEPTIEYVPTEFELDTREHEMLASIMERFTDATPRSIRIYYYRYLLAKRFIILTMKNNPIFSRAWRGDEQYRKLTPYLILHWQTNGPDVTTIPHNDEVSVTLFDKEFKVQKVVWDELLKIVEIVVPY